MSISGIGDGLGPLLLGMFIICVISVPLGIWKLIDIIIWFCKHISWQ